MRILIVSAKGKLAYSMEFAEALQSLGVESICVCGRDYCVFSEFKVLRHVPFPKLLKVIKRFNPHLAFADSAYYTPHIVKMAQQPLFLYLRGDVWTEIDWSKILYASLSKRMLFEWKSQVIKKGLKKADAIFTISRWLEKRVKQRLPNYPTAVLYKGIRPWLWKPTCTTTSFNFEHPAVVGVLNFEFPMKIYGLREFMKCAKRMSDVHFYFAGGGPYLNMLRMEIPRNMFLLGRIPKPKVQEFLAAGDVFVHPSGWDALPTTVVEASVMQKPIVASSVGGVPEIVKNNVTGYLCKVNDTEQWIKKIEFLLDNPSVGKKLGKNAQKYVQEKFNWKTIAKGFMENLRNILH